MCVSGFAVGCAVGKAGAEAQSAINAARTSKKMSFFKMADVAMPTIIIAQAIGRWGNFFNSEAFGTPTENFLKLYIPKAKNYKLLPSAGLQIPRASINREKQILYQPIFL